MPRRTTGANCSGCGKRTLAYEDDPTPHCVNCWSAGIGPDQILGNFNLRLDNKDDLLDSEMLPDCEE